MLGHLNKDPHVAVKSEWKSVSTLNVCCRGDFPSKVMNLWFKIHILAQCEGKVIITIWLHYVFLLFILYNIGIYYFFPLFQPPKKCSNLRLFNDYFLLFLTVFQWTKLWATEMIPEMFHLIVLLGEFVTEWKSHYWLLHPLSSNYT